MKILYNKKTKKILKHQGIRALRIMERKDLLLTVTLPTELFLLKTNSFQDHT